MCAWQCLGGHGTGRLGCGCVGPSWGICRGSRSSGRQKCPAIVCTCIAVGMCVLADGGVWPVRCGRGGGKGGGVVVTVVL
eukprot:scaffold266897_cov35-Attheya_sp.AAC.1